MWLIGETPATYAPEESDDADDEADMHERRVGGNASMRAQRLQGRRRLKRAREWLCDALTLRKLLMWCCVGQQAMRVHFHLFAHGSINVKPDEAALFRLCSLRDSRALEVISILGRSLFSWAPASATAVWGLANAFYGPMSSWDPGICEVATATVNKVIGNLWRRFFVRLRGWPWNLIRYCDEGLSLEERRKVAQEFLDAPLCCLDEYFGRRLRKIVSCIEDLFLDPVVKFMRECFSRCLASTTHIENSFVHMRSFLSSCRRPPTMASLGSYHVLNELLRTHTSWLKSLAEARRSAFQMQSGTTGKRMRSAWAASKNHLNTHIRSNGFSSYVKLRWPTLRSEHRRDEDEPANAYKNRLLSLVAKDWGRLSAHDKRMYGRRSHAAAKRRRRKPDTVDSFLRASSSAFALQPDSPWGLSDQLFPLGEEAVRREMLQLESTESFVASQSKSWKEHCGCAVKPGGVIPEKVTVCTPCGEICSRCIGELPDATANLRRDLVKALQTVSKATRGIANDFGDVVIWVHPAAHGAGGLLVVLTSFLKAPEFSGEYIRLKPLDSEKSVCDRPVSVSYSWIQESAWTLPDFLSETDVCMELIDMLDAESHDMPASSLFEFHRVAFSVCPPGVYNLDGQPERVDLGAMMTEQARATLAAASMKLFAQSLCARKGGAGTDAEKSVCDRRRSRVRGGQAVCLEPSMDIDDDHDSSDSGGGASADVWAEAVNACDSVPLVCRRRRRHCEAELARFLCRAPWASMFAMGGRTFRGFLVLFVENKIQIIMYT